jgi:hypothetical protein
LDVNGSTIVKTASYSKKICSVLLKDAADHQAYIASMVNEKRACDFDGTAVTTEELARRPPQT